MALIKTLYFASLGDTLGSSVESIEVPQNIKTVESLKSYLSQRGNSWEEQFSESYVKCAINEVLATPECTIKDGDEVAFFPPVTGG